MTKQKIKHLLDLLKKTLNQSIFKNVLIVGGVSLIIKAIGFYKELIIAQKFGLSELLDTFLIAMLLPGFISTVFLGSYSNVFIPNYISELRRKGNIAAFQSTSLLITLSIAGFFILITYLFTDVYLSTFFSGHTPQYYSLVTTQLTYILPCILIWAITSLLSGLLNIANEFTYSTFSGVFMSLGIIISLLFFSEVLKERVLAIGVLGGSLSGLIFLLVVSLRKKVLFFGKPDFGNRNIIVMLKQVPAKISASLINALNPIVDQYFSAQLVIGSIAALSYGIKVPMLVIGLFGIALSKVLLPYFSKLTDNLDLAFGKLKKVLTYNFVVCLGIGVALYFGSEFIVALLFERQAFTPEDTQIVYRVQEMYILQI
ncbi:MAG: murein biosynthesis integral membrane protein MurJ, partial [Flavobacteriaceae bacterium]